MAGWHHQCNGHELGKTSGDGKWQRGLACYRPCGHKKSDRSGQLNNKYFLAFSFAYFWTLSYCRYFVPVELGTKLNSVSLWDTFIKSDIYLSTLNMTLACEAEFYLVFIAQRPWILSWSGKHLALLCIPEFRDNLHSFLFPNQLIFSWLNLFFYSVLQSVANRYLYMQNIFFSNFFSKCLKSVGYMICLPNYYKWQFDQMFLHWLTDNSFW